MHFTFEKPLFTPKNPPFTLHRGALSNSTAAVVHRGDVSLAAGLKRVAVAVPLGGHPGGTACFLKKMEIGLKLRIFKIF